MDLTVVTTNAFEKDLRRVKKQNKDLDKLEDVVNLLQARKPLPARCRLHSLHGNWLGFWDCHVEPDWLLLFKVTGTKLVLTRTGTHAEVFG